MSNFSSLKAAIQQYIKTNGNEEITGSVLQDILLSMVSVLGDTAINDLEAALQTETTNRTNADGTLQQNINNEATARGNADTALGNRLTAAEGAITTINTMLGEGYVYVGIATPSTNPGTPTGKVFYIATAAGTYNNFSGIELTQGINILKYNGSAWSSEQVIAIDDEPTVGSGKLVKSEGVALELYRNYYLLSKGQTVYNLFNPANAVKGKIYNISGQEVSVSGYFHSGFIPVFDNIIFRDYLNPSISCRCLCWDENFVALGNATYEEVTNVSDWYTKCTLVAGTKYITINGVLDNDVAKAKVFYRYYNDCPLEDSTYGKALGLMPIASYTDRGQIFSTLLALNGYIEVPDGVFPLHNFNMPQGTTMRGNGINSIIKGLEDNTDLYAKCIICGGDNIIENITFKGQQISQPSTNTVFFKDGIYVKDGYSNIVITGCNFIGFTGSGICVKETGYSQLESIRVSNCFFKWNGSGINFDWRGEFAEVSNCTFKYNAYGVYNGAGNNKFSCCGFDGNNIGFCVYRADPDSPNNGHGSCVASSMNHNRDYGILVMNNNYGYTFCGCEIHANGVQDIYSVSATGVIFSGCQIGTNAKVRIGYSPGNIMIGCTFGNSGYTFTTDGNYPPKLISCFTLLGDEVVLP